MPTRFAACLAAVILCLSASTARAGDFVDSRITWTFGDDDVLAEAGEVFPESPLPSVGNRSGYELFFDNLDTRYDGRENVTHLVVYRQMPSLLDDRLTVEAAGVLLVDFAALYGHSARVSDVLGDDGSYIRLRYAWSRSRPDDGLEVVLFPLSTERFRIGYLYDLSWGGGGIFTSRRTGMTPGLKLLAAVGPVYAFVGLKTAIISQEAELEGSGSGGAEPDVIGLRETNYGGIAGAGADVTRWLRIDGSGGFFQTGTFPISGLRAEPVYSFGGSARVVFHQGVPVQTSPDFLLYRNDPASEEGLARLPHYVPGRLSWDLSMEGTAIGQHLADQAEMGETSLQVGYAAALQLRFMYGYLRAHFVALSRSAAHLLHDVPSIVPFVAIAEEDATVMPEYFGAIGVDYHLPGPRLTIGGVVGARMPAYYTSDTSDVTVVLGDRGIESRLPRGDTPFPVVAARVSLRWDVAQMLSFLAMVQYVRDANHTQLESTPLGTRRVFQKEDHLGFAVTAQARF